MYILAINSGSQTLKYKLYQKQGLELVKEGKVVDIGFSGIKNHREALAQVGEELKEFEAGIEIVGHRYVNGGVEFRDPLVVGGEELKELGKYNGLAPLHNPYNLLGIQAAREIWPKARNVAVFDTAFYKDLPEKVWRYAIDKQTADQRGYRRMGFHGISHDFCVGEAIRELEAGAEEAEKGRYDWKIISLHLGGGASITASSGGKAIDTSMGYTPLEGLAMMTRSGDVGAGVVLDLVRRAGKGVDEAVRVVDNFLNEHSGLFGLCGKQSMLEVLDNLDDPEVKLAFDIYVYRMKKYIGAYWAALGGCDALVFTGTVGAGREETREAVVEGLNFLGDARIMAIETNEELVIARESAKTLGTAKAEDK